MHNILYLSHWAHMYGSEHSLLELLSNLNRSQFNPIVVMPERTPMFDKLSKLDIEAVIVPLNKMAAPSPLPYLETLYRLYVTTKRYEARLIHANDDIANQYGLPVAKLMGIPIVTFTRVFLTPRGFRRMFLSYADTLVANSHAVASTYLRDRSGSQRRYIIHNGIDLDKFQPREYDFRKVWNISQETFLIAVIGRITPSKGQDVFIKALQKVVNEVSDCRAVLVGDTEIEGDQWYLDKLHRMVEEFSLKQNVTFAGYVDDIRPLLGAVDLVVLPSLWEPFGRVLIEAMAMEKPVVATRAGGTAEVVDDGITGFLVAPKDDLALAEAMLKIIRNRELAGRLGQQGRRRAECLFSIQENVRQIEHVYLELLER